jgi:nucleoporin GLE1
MRFAPCESDTDDYASHSESDQASEGSGVLIKQPSSPAIIVLEEPIPDDTAQEDGTAQDGYVYDSDDSEDLLYPVHPGAPLIDAQTSWAAYRLDTERAVRDAAAHKALEVLKVAGLVQAWARDQELQRRQAEEAEWQLLETQLDKVSLAQKEEDAAMQSAWHARSEALTLEVEKTIAAAERDAEAKRQRLLELEAERQRKIKEAEEQARREQEAAQLRKEQEKALERQRVLQEEEKRRDEQEATKANVLAQKQKSETEARQAEEKAQAEARLEQAKALEQEASAAPRKEAEEYRALLEALKSQVLQPVAAQPNLKNHCFRAKGRITVRIGQVTSSLAVLKTTVQGLHGVFTEAQQLDPRCLRWCLNFFCKALIKQAEGEVTGKASAAYPLGLLCLLLIKPFPELKDLYLARLAKKCPWTIPYVQHSLDTESGRKLLGYKRNQAGKYESIEGYNDRQKGIFTLYAATTSILLEDSPVPIERCWQTLSRLMNLKLTDADLLNTSFAMLDTALDVAGRSLLDAFGDLGKQLILAAGLYVGETARGPQAGSLRNAIEDYVQRGELGLDFSFRD